MIVSSTRTVVWIVVMMIAVVVNTSDMMKSQRLYLLLIQPHTTSVARICAERTWVKDVQLPAICARRCGMKIAWFRLWHPSNVINRGCYVVVVSVLLGPMKWKGNDTNGFQKYLKLCHLPTSHQTKFAAMNCAEKTWVKDVQLFAVCALGYGTLIAWFRPWNLSV